MAACGPREANTVAAVPETMQPVDDFESTARGTLSRDWYTVQPAYTVEVGQVSTREDLKATTLAVWRSEAPVDHFAEIKVGDLAGGTFDEFRSLQVFVRLKSLGGSERVSFQYSSDARRYEIRHEGRVTRVLAHTARSAPPELGDILRLEARGDRYVGLLNGRTMLETQGPRLEGRHAGFAVGIDLFTVGIPKRVIDAWAAGALD
jgi:hypothetical protein